MAGSTAIDPLLIERFTEALARLNPEGEKLGLAVSGGPDSMAMLLLAHEAIPGGFEVATVDHGLRPDAKDECALVVAACDERAVTCEVLTVEVGEGNVQAEARWNRYEALVEWAAKRGIAILATAHHADDQAETFLMRLNRGSGVRGLAGVRADGRTPDGRMRLVRPLLGFRRRELRAVVETADTSFATDPSNDDESFDRVRIRKALAEADWLNVEAIAASAAHLAEADEALTDYEQLLGTKHSYGGRDVAGIRRPQDLSHEMQVRLVNWSLAVFGVKARGSDIARLIERLSAGKGGNLGRVLATVKDGDWVFRPEPPRKTG